MPRLCVMFGLPASGKTTAARQMGGRGWKVHSYDELHAALKGRYGDSDINGLWVEAMKSDLLAGHDVVCDCQCLQAHQRTWLLRQIGDVPCRKTLVAMVVSVEACVERNARREGAARVPEHQIRAAARLMQPPTDAEGWDEIIVYR